MSSLVLALAVVAFVGAVALASLALYVAMTRSLPPLPQCRQCLRPGWDRTPCPYCDRH